MGAISFRRKSRKENKWGLLTGHGGVLLVRLVWGTFYPAITLNLIRAAAVRRARRKAGQADNSPAGTFLKLFAVVKERIYKIVSRSGPFFQEVTRTADDYLKIAA